MEGGSSSWATAINSNTASMVEHASHSCRLTTSIGRLLTRCLHPRGGSPPLELASRSRSMEVLSAGREQSAPYLPSKHALPALLPTGQRAAMRWRRACQAVMDAREVTACLDLLSDRLAPAEDRLHAAAQLALRLQAYSPQQQQQQGEAGQQLVWALLARRAGGGQKWGEHLLQELYVTGVYPPSLHCLLLPLPCCRSDRRPPRASSCSMHCPSRAHARLSAQPHIPHSRAGERLFGFFTPPAMGRHRPYFTCTAVTVLLLVFFFMAGEHWAGAEGSSAVLHSCDAGEPCVTRGGQVRSLPSSCRNK